jgi:hypothetical protein
LQSALELADDERQTLYLRVRGSYHVDTIHDTFAFLDHRILAVAKEEL